MNQLKLLFVTIILISCSRPSDLPDPLGAGWNGKDVCEIEVENEKIRVLKCTFPPGVGHERHYHAPHFCKALKGSKFRLTDSTGTREADFPTGASYWSDGVEWHEALNIGDSVAEILIIELKN